MSDTNLPIQIEVQVDKASVDRSFAEIKAKAEAAGRQIGESLSKGVKFDVSGVKSAADGIKKVSDEAKSGVGEQDKLNASFKRQIDSLMILMRLMHTDSELLKDGSAQRRVLNSLLHKSEESFVGLNDEQLRFISGQAKTIEGLQAQRSHMTSMAVAAKGLTESEKELIAAKIRHQLAVKQVSDAVKDKLTLDAKQQAQVNKLVAAQDLFDAKLKAGIMSQNAYAKAINTTIIKLEQMGVAANRPMVVPEVKQKAIKQVLPDADYSQLNAAYDKHVALQKANASALAKYKSDESKRVASTQRSEWDSLNAAYDKHVALQKANAKVLSDYRISEAKRAAVAEEALLAKTNRLRAAESDAKSWAYAREAELYGRTQTTQPKTNIIKQSQGGADNLMANMLAGSSQAERQMVKLVEQANVMNKKFDETNSLWGRIHSQIRAAALLTTEFTRAFFLLTTVAGGFSIPAIIGTSYLKNIEDAKVGMSGILMSMGQINGESIKLNDALSISDEMINRLGDASLKYAVKLDDLVSVFQATLAPGLGAGMKLEEIQQISTVGSLAVKNIGLDSKQVVQEIRDLVAGGIQAASSTLATALGLRDSDIKKAKESSEGLFQFLIERLSGFGQTAELRANTLSGIFETIQIKIQRLFANPEAFEGLKNILKDISDSIGKFDGTKFTPNKELVEAMKTYWTVLQGVLDVTKTIVVFTAEWINIIEGVSKAYLGTLLAGAVMPKLAALFEWLKKAAFGWKEVGTAATMSATEQAAAAGKAEAAGKKVGYSLSQGVVKGISGILIGEAILDIIGKVFDIEPQIERLKIMIKSGMQEVATLVWGTIKVLFGGMVSVIAEKITAMSDFVGVAASKLGMNDTADAARGVSQTAREYQIQFDPRKAWEDTEASLEGLRAKTTEALLATDKEYQDRLADQAKSASESAAKSSDVVSKNAAAQAQKRLNDLDKDYKSREGLLVEHEEKRQAIIRDSEKLIDALRVKGESTSEAEQQRERLLADEDKRYEASLNKVRDFGQKLRDERRKIDDLNLAGNIINNENMQQSADVAAQILRTMHEREIEDTTATGDALYAIKQRQLSEIRTLHEDSGKAREFIESFVSKSGIQFSDSMFNKMKSNNAKIVDVTKGSAMSRVDIEQNAADAIIAANDAVYQSKMRAAQASTFSSDKENLARGGAVRTNASGEFAFVSSWDEQGNYVGDLGKSVGSNMKFATGGSFVVGGQGGTDSQLIKFMATPGERVTIQTPQQQRESGSQINSEQQVNITINVSGADDPDRVADAVVAKIQDRLKKSPNMLSSDNRIRRTG